MKLSTVALCAALAAPSAGEVRVLALGDSLTEGLMLDQQERYSALLERQLRQDGFDVSIINDGVGGARTESGLGRLKAAWKNPQTRPDVLLLALGANDGLRRVPPTTIERHLSETLAFAREHGIRPVVAGLRVPRFLDPGHGYADAFESVFERVAARYQALLVPSFLEGVMSIPSMNLPDGLHPNARGHARMAETLLPYLERALSTPLATQAS